MQKKLRWALDWNVPAVRPGWLWDCIESGQKLQFDPYLIHPAQRVHLRNIKQEPKTSQSKIRTDSRGSNPKLNGKISADSTKRNSQAKEADQQNDPVSGGEVHPDVSKKDSDGSNGGFHTPTD